MNSSRPMAAGATRLRQRSAPELFLAPEDDAHDVGLEFFPDVSKGARAEAARAAPCCLLPRRRARRQPGVFDDVVDRVAREARPRKLEMAVGVVGEKGGLQRIAKAGLEALPAGGNVVRALAPDRAETSFERVGDRHVCKTLGVSLAH